MKNPYITAILAVTALSFSTGAMAESMTKSEYKTAEKNIESDYQSAKGCCNSFANNAKDICLAVAKGNEKVAKAELEARYKPSKKAGYEVSVTKAKADYEVAKEKCDDLAGNVKDVCVEEAKAALVNAESDAKAQFKTEKTMIIANEKSSEAHKDAAADKRDAGYAVAKEKCDALSGNAKNLCVDKAKMHHGQ